MEAAAGNQSNGYYLIKDVPWPVPQPGEVLVRVDAVALNHYDYKIIEFGVSSPSPYVGGCDFAGVVVAVGPSITRFREGDRILSFNTHGGFAEYAIAIEDLSCLIPDGMPFNEACSLGSSIGVAGLALFQEPGLNLPVQESNDSSGARNSSEGEYNAATTVLISGGASSSGTMATQLLRLAGFNPIVTCSPTSYDLCKSFGATACFDYHSTTCGADIRSHTDNKLGLVLDCVTDANTMSLCYEAMGAQGGSYIALEPIASTVKYTRRDIRADWVMANTLLGGTCSLAGVYGRPSTLRHREFASNFYTLAEGFLNDAKIRNHPIRVLDGGLANINNGLQELRTGTVKGRKLVVPVSVEV
ncbi:hypothetical protein NLG97_g2617 [Lecanicillium saksenae]|uniref:Uncharacterized protein n=1 Tax=Lecanicillium saksenae TaxID=468837 RepID=A0ACC1R4F8_9HYPO|nr:hypothetical protein NLG97_g2617 [Lecanicillium saksenae]